MLALRVYQNVNVGDFCPDFVDAVSGEPAVHTAMTAPEDHPGPLQLLGGQPAAGFVRIEHHAVVQRHPKFQNGGVPPQVLVG
ncbi:MAG: hypothetical protein MUD05_07590, partial [Candidatus Nanopelagicales bacterium]|nr:hypothetical protein [Candidatus Nanopelagicales bacterium]